MKNLKVCFSLCICMFIFLSCEVKVDTGNTSSEKKNGNTESSGTASKDETNPDSEIIKAKFVDFQLGDASHYYFTDESGKKWEFAENEDKNFDFAIELPESEITEENQGWGANKDLQGNWFIINYEYKEMQQYQDGPMATLPVIVQVKLAD